MFVCGGFFLLPFIQNPSLCLPAVTLCKVGEFQCKDGSCISNYSRCDQVVNCEDASDEMNCREWPGGVSVLTPSQMVVMSYGRVNNLFQSDFFVFFVLFFQKPLIAPVSSGWE